MESSPRKTPILAMSAGVGGAPVSISSVTLCITMNRMPDRRTAKAEIDTHRLLARRPARVASGAVPRPLPDHMPIVGDGPHTPIYDERELTAPADLCDAR